MGELKSYSLISNFKGLNTKTASYLIPQGNSPNLQNVDFYETGAVSKVKGYTKYNFSPILPYISANQVTYTCDVLPTAATPVWTKYNTGATGVTEEINPAGILHVAIATPNLYYYRDEASINTQTTGVTVEARVKVTGSTSRLFGMTISDTTILYGKLHAVITPNSIGVTSNYLSTAEEAYIMNTTDDYHIYRVTWKGDNVKLYVDGSLKIDTALIFSTDISTSKYFLFGSHFAATDYKVDYVAYSYEGAFSPLGNGIKSIYRGYRNDGANITRRLIVSRNKDLYKGDDSSGVFTSFKTGLSLSQNFDFETFTDLWIMTNGADAPLKYNDTTVADLGGTPPIASYTVLHKNRLWLFKNPSNKSRGYFSALSNPESWGATDWIDFRTNDGDIITGAISSGDRLYVFKENSFFIVFGDGPDNFKVEGPLFNLGAISRQSIKNINNDIFFLSKNAVESFSGSVLSVPPVSFPIENMVEDIVGKKEITTTVLSKLNFNNKIAGSIVENKSMLKYLQSTSQTPSPTDGGWAEVSQTEYDNIEADDALNANRNITSSTGPDTDITTPSTPVTVNGTNWGVPADTVNNNTGASWERLGTAGDWIKWDLGSIQPVSKFGVYAATGEGATDTEISYLETSTDNINWTVVKTAFVFTPNQWSWATWTPINARYLRCRWEYGTYSGQSYNFYEIEIRLAGNYYPNPIYVHYLNEWDVSDYLTANILKLFLKAIGYGVGTAQGLYARIFNASAANWESMGSNTAVSGSSDSYKTIYKEIVSNISNYISSNKIKILLSSLYPSSSPNTGYPSAIWIDFSELGFDYKINTNISQTVGGELKTKYLLSVFGENDDKVLGYDFLRRDWTLFKGLNASCFAKAKGSGDEGEVWFGDANNGFVYKFDENSLDGAGTPIDSFYETKADDFNSIKGKLYKKMSFFAKGKGVLTVVATTYWDKIETPVSSQKTITVNLTDENMPLKFEEKINLRGRIIKLKFSNANVGETFTIYPPVVIDYLEMRR